LDKEKLIRNVAQLLRETPSSSDIVIKDEKEEARYLYLAKYMIEKAMKEDALLHSDDYGSIAIVFHKHPNKKEAVLSNLWQDLKLAWKVTGIKKGLSALKIQKTLKTKYPSNEPYLYCWFLGVVSDERGVTDKMLAYKMKDRILAISNEKKLPLIAETRTKRIALAYVRYGFKIFEKWDHPNGGKMYFLRYEPGS
jgi:hypothetical protein